MITASDSRPVRGQPPDPPASVEAVSDEEAVSARYWFDHHRDHERRRGRFAQLTCRLSPREREVLEQLAKGCRAVDIARRSKVSIDTVRAQIRTILATLEVSTQLEAVALLAGVTRPRASAQPGGVPARRVGVRLIM